MKRIKKRLDPQPSPALVSHRSGAGMPHVLRSAAPDREARAFLRLFNQANRLRPVEHYSVTEIRQVWRLTALSLGRRLPVARVIEQVIDGPAGPIELRVFTPRKSKQPLPAFLWCHGGGFMVGGLDTADGICRNIALAGDCISIAVRYRLTPEHDLNAGREDFLAALQWVAQHGATLGIDTTRLAVGGDSAGGNIAAAVAQENRRRGGTPLCLQVLAYPATDLVEEFPSLTENAEGFLLTHHLLEHIKQTIADAMDRLNPEDPWLSPRRCSELHGLPPALLVSAGFDPIRDDGLDYAAKLRAAGVPVELLHYAGQFHGFLNFDAVIGASRDALQRIGAGLAAAFRESARDLTLEIADQPSTGSAPLAAAGEVATSLLTVWTASEGWHDTLLRQLSPTVAAATRWLLWPCRTYSQLFRRPLGRRLALGAAQQTYPVGP
ncbi:alpha/beta hydrolase [Pseudomonas sp. UL073]|uniref:Alpha/beta hydrolase n=1 Tax=Zestomonas insulae TaxID=2809017 RepID=A0ABS2IKK8_9GAMM|nr:alpha/beta hydrolase [Pseudomonas insulae]MBM7062527.1 alpha/beta hydrolase [Pseudomonas insulae]